MANPETDGRLDDHEEIVEFNEAPQTEDNASPKGYEDYVAQEKEQEVVEPEPELPEKYQGKSVQDIIAMHQNAEKLLGKQSSEVGELRKVVDDFIRTQTVTQQQAPSAPVEEDIDDLDFFEDPKKAVSKLLENHPSVKQSQQMAIRLAQQEAVAQLKANHPDYTSIIKDQKFLDWVGQSKIRTDLLRKADSYDYESANELFSLWKERQNIVNDTVANETQARKQAVRSASTGSAKGSGEQSKRKIYRRADIVELMTKDPERYQALASEIRQAYSEGRVK
jgi:hypothetical protein